jgi:hypothetical protein
VNLRLSHLIGLFGMWLVLSGTPASAQTRTFGGGLQEWQFAPGSASTTCSSTNSYTGDNIVWGTSINRDTACTASAADDNIVWGTLFDDNIVWGTAGEDNIVWGTTFAEDNIVWGTVDTSDNIVWGTGFFEDNIVWGTASAPSSAFDY